MPLCAVVLSGTPLTERVSDVIWAVAAAGWQIQVAATAAAMDWVDADALAAIEEVTGYPPRVAFRDADHPTTPAPVEAVIVVPATFNTVNKVANGIADGYATYTVCEALGAHVQTVVVPMVTTQLWGHPALAENLASLSKAGATLVDPTTGSRGTEAVVPVTFAGAADLVTRFDPAWVVSALRLPA